MIHKIFINVLLVVVTIGLISLLTIPTVTSMKYHNQSTAKQIKSLTGFGATTTSKPANF